MAYRSQRRRPQRPRTIEARLRRALDLLAEIDILDTLSPTEWEIFSDLRTRLVERHRRRFFRATPK